MMVGSLVSFLYTIIILLLLLLLRQHHHKSTTTLFTIYYYCTWDFSVTVVVVASSIGIILTTTLLPSSLFRDYSEPPTKVGRNRLKTPNPCTLQQILDTPNDRSRPLLITVQYCPRRFTAHSRSFLRIIPPNHLDYSPLETSSTTQLQTIHHPFPLDDRPQSIPPLP